MTIYCLANLVGGLQAGSTHLRAILSKNRIDAFSKFTTGVETRELICHQNGPSIGHLIFSIQIPAITNYKCHLYAQCMLIFSVYQCSSPLTWPWQDQHGATKSSCAPCELQGVGNVDCPVAGGQGGNMCRSMSAEDGWLVWASDEN